MNPALLLLPVLGPVVGAPAPERPPRLCFSCSFDGSVDADYAAGEARAIYREARFVPGRHGQALAIGKDWAAAPFYSSRGNLPKAAGAMEMWVRVDWEPKGEVQRCFFHEDAPHEAGQNAIWIWQVTGDTLRLDVRDPAGTGLTTKVLGTWRPGEWHHLAATWRCDRGAALYVDGKLAAESHFRFEPLEYDWFNLGSRPFGTGELEGAIDDFRIYDQPLTPEDVQTAYEGTFEAERAPKTEPATAAPWPERAQTLFSYAGVLSMKARIILWKDWGALSFWLRPGWGAHDRRERVVFAEPGPGQPGDARFRLVKPAGRAELRFEVNDFRGTYVAGALDETWRTPAWHHVALAWANGRGLAMWLDGFPAVRPYVVGYDEVEWYSVGREVSIDVAAPCTGVSIKRLAVHSRPLTTDEVWGEIGDWAEPLIRLAPSAVRADGRAPVLVLRNPGPQLLGGRLSWSTGGGKGAQQLFLQPGKEVTLPVSLPRREPGRATLQWQWEGSVERRGELTCEVLPPEPPARPAKLEGLALAWTGPGEPKAATWPELERAVDRLSADKRGAASLLYVPWVTAAGPRYDSWAEPNCGLGETPACPLGFGDYLLARMAGQGRQVVVGLEATAFPSLQPDYLTPTTSLAGGVENPCTVLFRGKVIRFPQGGRQPTLNALHPKVQQRLAALASELLARCGPSRAFAGLGVRLTPAYCGWLYDPQASYDALTLGAFASETGLPVPLDVSDPWKTNEAYRWLRAHAWEQWLTWRAGKLTAFYLALADRVAASRPGARLHLVLDPTALPDLPKDETALQTRLLEGGLDLAALEASRNVVVDRLGAK